MADSQFIGVPIQFQDRTHSKTCRVCHNTFYRDKRCTWMHWERVTMCSRECTGVARTMKAQDERIPMREHFEQWFVRGKPDECWEWLGSTNPKRGNYGAYAYARKMRGAHVVALELDGRPVPKGMYACHTCDNPKCVNPAHLYVGTPQQNVDDKVSRGRQRKGTSIHSAKLDDKAVFYIRHSSLSDKMLAQLSGVSDGAIRHIRNGKTWKHVK